MGTEELVIVGEFTIIDGDGNVKVHETNVVTYDGFMTVFNSLGGKTTNWGLSAAVGTSPTPEHIADTSLSYQSNNLGGSQVTVNGNFVEIVSNPPQSYSAERTCYEAGLLAHDGNTLMSRTTFTGYIPSENDTFIWRWTL